MKALTLTQPWATLVAIVAKRIETRSWRTNYRGPLAIHAAKGPDKTGFVVTDPCYSMIKRAGLDPIFLPHGFVVATCNLVNIVEMPAHIVGHPCTWDWVDQVGREYCFIVTDKERAFGNYAPGRYAWLLADVKPLPEPSQIRGSLGLWDWDGPK